MRTKLSAKNKTIAKIHKSKLHFIKNDFSTGELYKFINKVGLKSLLNPSFFNSISCGRRTEMERLLPKCDKALIQDSFMNGDLDILNNVYFNCACKYWMSNLKEGNFSNFLNELSHKLSKKEQKHLKIEKNYPVNGDTVSNNCHNLYLEHAHQSSLLSSSIHKPLNSEETDDDYHHIDYTSEDGRNFIQDGSLGELKSFFKSKEEIIEYARRQGLRGMLLDHGYYCRPFQPQIFIQDNLDVLFFSQEMLSVSFGTSNRCSQTNQKKICETTDEYLNALPPNTKKISKKPQFLRVILHKRSGHDLIPSPLASSFHSICSVMNTNQNEDNLTETLLTFIQKLLTSKTNVPCLIPISMIPPIRNHL